MKPNCLQKENQRKDHQIEFVNCLIGICLEKINQKTNAHRRRGTKKPFQYFIWVVNLEFIGSAINSLGDIINTWIGNAVQTKYCYGWSRRDDQNRWKMINSLNSNNSTVGSAHFSSIETFCIRNDDFDSSKRIAREKQISSKERQDQVIENTVANYSFGSAWNSNCICTSHTNTRSSY